MRPHFSKVSFDLKPIQQEAVWPGVLEKDSQWAFVHGAGCQIAMRNCYDNYGLSLGQAKRLKTWVLENFTEEKIYKQLVDAIGSENHFELEDWLNELEEVTEG